MLQAAGPTLHGAGQAAMPTGAVPAPSQPIGTKPPPCWWGRDRGGFLQGTMGLRITHLHSPCARRASQG